MKWMYIETKLVKNVVYQDGWTVAFKITLLIFFICLISSKIRSSFRLDTNEHDVKVKCRTE